MTNRLELNTANLYLNWLNNYMDKPIGERTLSNLTFFNFCNENEIDYISMKEVLSSNEFKQAIKTEKEFKLVLINEELNNPKTSSYRVGYLQNLEKRIKNELNPEPIKIEVVYKRNDSILKRIDEKREEMKKDINGKD